MAYRRAQLFQADLKFMFGRQGNSASVAAFEADFAAGETAKWMRHGRPAGFGVPFKDVVRAEVEALEVRTARFRVNRRKPGKFLAERAQHGHSSILHASHE
jgi:hypothetical protein